MTPSSDRFSSVLKITCSLQHFFVVSGFLCWPTVEAPVYILEPPMFLDFQSSWVAFFVVLVLASGFHIWPSCCINNTFALKSALLHIHDGKSFAKPLRELHDIAVTEYSATSISHFPIATHPATR